jgi:hypothetical protein
VGWGNFGLGIDASSFNTLSNFDFDAYAAPLRALDFLTVTGSNNSWRSTSFTFGPSYSISFRSVKPISGVGIVVKHNYPKASLKLSVKGGITMNEAPDNFSVMNNVTRKEIAAYSAPADFQKNAFTLKPSISFSYWLSQSIALNANVQYAMQTGQTPFKTAQKDLTNISIAPTMSPDQFTKNISTAPNIITSTVGPDKYLSAGIGIAYRFGRKGWDGSIKGNKKGINENGLKKNDAEYVLTDAEVKAIAETLVNMRKGWDGTVKGGNIVEKKGINEGGLKKNDAEYVLTDAEVKAIAETLVNMRKGWDGTVKGGNIVEKKGIQENGVKENEAKSENTNLRIKTIAETLVNLARKGWDGSVKGNKVDYKPTDSDIELVTETLENIRKGWDGSVKGNKTEYVANGADVKAIAETMVNLRKGWDGSVKGGKIQKTKHDTVKNSINNVR